MSTYPGAGPTTPHWARICGVDVGGKADIIAGADTFNSIAKFLPQPSVAKPGRSQSASVLPRQAASQQSSKFASALRLQALVHIAKSLGHGSHELQCEVRRLLDEEQKALFVDGRDGTVGFGDRCCGARLLAEQRHFAKHAANSQRLDNNATYRQVYFALDQYIHDVASVTFLEYRLTRLKSASVIVPAKHLHRCHGFPL